MGVDDHALISSLQNGSDPKGPLSTSLSTGTIKAANKAALCDGRGQKAHVCFRNY